MGFFLISVWYLDHLSSFCVFLYTSNLYVISDLLVKVKYCCQVTLYLHIMVFFTNSSLKLCIKYNLSILFKNPNKSLNVPYLQECVKFLH